MVQPWIRAPELDHSASRAITNTRLTKLFKSCTANNTSELKMNSEKDYHRFCSFAVVKKHLKNTILSSKLPFKFSFPLLFYRLFLVNPLQLGQIMFSWYHFVYLLSINCSIWILFLIGQVITGIFRILLTSRPPPSHFRLHSHTSDVS